MSNDYDEDFSSGIAAFEAKNFSQAMRFLHPLAVAGNAEAQHRVAIMCQNGLGMVRNERALPHRCHATTLSSWRKLSRPSDPGHTGSWKK